MKRTLIFVLMSVILLSACAPAAKDVEASDVWARTGMAGGNSAVYMVLVNGTDMHQELLFATSDVAEAVELHESRMGDSGEMQMIPQASIPLAAGAKVEFKPGGLHVMLIGLKQELKVGDEFEVTLHFKDHADITLKVIVKEAMMDM
ncbi:MAG: copper chaperone PCu(A)C [Anaerolineaceae bacterium]|nr:MAG: copper chaperone PCu(A)C [Anaerolineaceae bacterium]